MQIVISIFFSLIFTYQLSAQTLAERYDYIKEDFLGKTYFGVNAGIAIPFKEFADNNFNKLTSGYAKTGFTYNFTFRYAFTDDFGLAAKYFNTTNSFDAQKYQNDFNNNNAPYTCMFTSDPWTVEGFMIVPTYLLRSRKYNFELGIGVGKVASTLPQNTLTVTSPTDSINIFSQGAYQSSNWAVSIEGAFRYLIAKNVILSAQGDVLITDQTYKNVYTYLSNNTGNYVIIPPVNYLQPFRIIHFTVGIGFQLDNR